ncbi:MAG: hypothetical protein JXO22_11235 [Phycisphaerae bacterium]|nr:hypothetical protein [Phycisphaerae bacterium]
MRMMTCTWMRALLVLAVPLAAAAQVPGENAGAEAPDASNTEVGDSLVADETAPAADARTDSLLDSFSFDITYYLYSDYVFRGMNFSEYATERGEALNHQMTTTLGVDCAQLFGGEEGKWGTFAFDTFWEWYEDQRDLDPASPNALQEVDWTFSYSYEVAPIATTATAGLSLYTFPSTNGATTEEWFVSLEHNDAWMWKWLFPENEDGVFNPSILYAQDIDEAAGGAWIEFGLSHDFVLFEDLTLTPLITFAFDRRYIGRTLGDPELEDVGLAYTQYGLEVGYDVSSGLKIPEEYGGITLQGFIYFNNTRDRYNINDSNVENIVFGGMSLGWSF